MTSQDKFAPQNGWTKETMIAHMRKEFRGKSIDNRSDYKSSCMYRTPDGKKCAVGMFIPDDQYDKAMDEVMGNKNGTGVDTILAFWPEIAKVTPLEENPLTMLQRVHDGQWGLQELRTDDQILAELIQWVEKNVA